MEKDYEKITATDYDGRILEKSYETHKKEYYDEQVQFNKLKRTLKHAGVQGKKVLELGCSMGFFSFALAREGANVTAVDYSAQSLEIAKQFLKEKKNKDLALSFHQMDARNLTFAPESFDVLVNYDFIEHIYPGDHKQVVKEMFRVLKKDGIAAIYTPNYNRVRMEYYIQKIKKGLEGKKWGWQESESGEDHQDTKLHVGLLSLNQLIYLFEKNGFTVFSCDNEEYSFPGIHMLNKIKIFPNIFTANSFIFVRKIGNV
ncbi:MAG: methyltransferase domain-containing protein [Nanoarchaeota archaeon]